MIDYLLVIVSTDAAKATAPEPPVDLRGRRREAKLSQILTQAWLLAERDGLAAISLRDLAEAVELRQPSLYAYFDSKAGLYDLMFGDGNRQLLALVATQTLTGDPREDLIEFVRLLVGFSAANVVRHQLLFQRTIPGFEPSPRTYALALEFIEVARERLRAAGVDDPADLDVFSALVSGLAHQQVANDPGGDRWVRLAARSVDMFLTEIDQRNSSDDKGTKQ